MRPALFRLSYGSVVRSGRGVDITWFTLDATVEILIDHGALRLVYVGFQIRLDELDVSGGRVVGIPVCVELIISYCNVSCPSLQLCQASNFMSKEADTSL